jgi:hypothetical protein
MLDKSKIELSTIGGIVLVLVLVSIFAVKPGILLKEVRNSTRISHMETVLNAVYMYVIDQRGIFPPCIPDPGKGAVNIVECIELRPYLSRGIFPTDPRSDARYMIEYFPERETKLRIFSTAKEAEGVEIIR